MKLSSHSIDTTRKNIRVSFQKYLKEKFVHQINRREGNKNIARRIDWSI
jgi:hypothetical protein